MSETLARLLAEARDCTVCAPHLPQGVRPILQAGPGARIVIIGQAPGARVHASGVPWDDESGKRLRDWTGLDPETFYNPEQVALLPMGFCYPGKGASADLPPRPECAPLWHPRFLAALPAARLTLLVGIHAQRRYLGGGPMTENVRRFAEAPAGLFALPHPSWRVVGWMRGNGWFTKDVLPALRREVGLALA